MKFPEKLGDRLEKRSQQKALRSLGQTSNLVDFASNDYIGYCKSESIFLATHKLLCDRNLKHNGASGSRLLSGNFELYTETENFLCAFHKAEAALLFNSGYDANVGFFSSVAQKSDLILYDELCHASIRDGIQLSVAKSYKFIHNDFEDLQRKITNFKQSQQSGIIYIVTETVFSMDGDSPNLEELVGISQKNDSYLVVDEAHALGVFGQKGQGLVDSLGLQDKIFARIVTFGKALGAHGAVVLGSESLKSYLVNFARSLIYTTGLSPHSVATILIAYQHLEKETQALEALSENIKFFNQHKKMLSLNPMFIRSKSAIQSAIIPGNEKVKRMAAKLQQNGFDVKAILSPTVPLGQERLRICLHSYNTKDHISSVLELLCSSVWE